MNSSDADWTAAWEHMLGTVPSAARDLREISPAAEKSYRELRLWINDDRPDGLSRAEKELVMVVLNIAVGHRGGAISHMRAGLKNGLTVTQLRETLAQCFLSLGVIEFLKTGQAVWQAYAQVAVDEEVDP